DEDLQLAWLAELERLVRPNGIVMLTVQGRREAERILAPNDFQQFAAKGFLYRKPTDRRTLEGMPDFYQVSFHDSAYIQRIWTEWFEPIGFISRGSHTQDAILLRKRKTKTT